MSYPLVKSTQCAVLFVSSLLSSSIIAEELPTIVVSATRSEQASISTSASILVITKQDIATSGAVTVVDVLRGRSGIQVNDLFGDGGSSSINMRGFASTANANTLIMVDGRRLNYSDTRAPDLSYISVNDIERIEIVQGSSGVLFGDQAVGGVINIITTKPGKFAAKIEMQSGSYNRNGMAFFVSEKTDNGLSYKLNAEAYKTDNYRDHNEHSHVNVSAYAAKEYSKGNVFIELQKVEDDLELPGALIQSELDDDPTQINSGFIDDFSNSDTQVKRLGISHELGDDWVLEAELSRRELEQDVEQSFRNNPSAATGFANRDLKSINPRLIGSFDGTLVTVGMDREDTDYELFIPNAFGVSQQSNDQDTKSVYAQIVKPLHNNLTATLGLRQSKVDNDISDTGTFTFPALNANVKDSVMAREIGFKYKTGDASSVFVRMDDNYRFAKIDEFALAENYILKTQEGRSWEAGYEKHSKDSDVKVTVYRLALENEIFYDPSAGAFGANVNIDETRHDGLMLDYSRSLSEDMSVSLNYTYSDATIRFGAFDGNDISGISDNQLSFRMNMAVNETVEVYGEIIATDDKYAQGDNANTEEKIRGYAISNASVLYQHKNVRVSFKVNNVFNIKYTEFVTNNGFGAAYQPSPERNYLVTASYTF